MTIGEFINNYLLDHQMSQRQFAKKCNFSNGYISMLINNVNPNTIIEAINKYVGSIEDFEINRKELILKD